MSRVVRSAVCYLFSARGFLMFLSLALAFWCGTEAIRGEVFSTSMLGGLCFYCLWCLASNG